MAAKNPPRHQPSPFTRGQIRIYIYLHIIGVPKRRDQQLHKKSRRHRSLNKCLDSLSGPDGPSRPSVPLSVCQDCLVASPLLPRCCRLRWLGPFPWPVVTRHERSPRRSLMNAPQRNGSCRASVPLRLQRFCRCGLVYLFKDTSRNKSRGLSSSP